MTTTASFDATEKKANFSPQTIAGASWNGPDGSASWVERMAPRVAQVFLAAWLLASLLNALEAVFVFAGYPVNGPFQLYDPLRRIAAGQQAGESFQFFHGIGIPFLHYPLFRLFGGHSLTASELSRQLTSLLLFVGSLWVLLYAASRGAAAASPAGRDKKIQAQVRKAAWVLAALVVLALEVLFPGSAQPGHSLISGRSAMPLFGFAVLFMPWGRMKKALAFGACIGGAFAFGTEHGISLTLSLFVVEAVAAVHAVVRRNGRVFRSNLLFGAVALLSAVATGGSLLLAFCGPGGAAKALRYNLGELPADQFWFFGSPPMPYLTSLSQLLTDRHVALCFLPSALIGLTVLLLTVRGWKKTFEVGEGLQAVSTQMLTYGVLTAIPLIGILSRHYVYPQTRICLFAGAASVLFYCAGRGRFLRPMLPARWTKGSALIFASVCLLVSATMLWHGTGAARKVMAQRTRPVRFDRSLDSHWESFMADATDVINGRRTRPALSLWSEYAALLDAHYGTFQPAEDYIIHAVGQKRWAHYVDTFRRTNPEFVTTMTSQFSFAEWLQNERWDFYEALLDNYDPVANVSHDTIWQRRNEAWREPANRWNDLRLDGAHATLPAASSSGDVSVVEVRYTVANPWGKLPLIGNTPRYLARLSGTERNMAISFAPYETAFRFPVKRSVSGPVRIDFVSESFLPGSHFTVTGVRTRELPPSHARDVLFTKRQAPSPY